MSFVVVFLIISVVATAGLRGPINKRIKIYSQGAGHPDLLLMVWIFLLAGAFASTAKTMGAIDAAVNISLAILPASMILPGLFLSACLISFSVGTSVGTIVALVPVAAAMAEAARLDAPTIVGCVVGGSFFGDNLSFISDTTIVATRSQGVRLKDKFYANLRIVLPAAVVTLILYAWLGFVHVSPQTGMDYTLDVSDLLLTLPYFSVIVLALFGVNVFVVLLSGNVLAGVVGLLTGHIDAEQWMAAVSSGLAGMQETILIALMAGGLLAVLRHRGAIDWIIRFLTRRISGRRGAEGAIAALVAVTNCLTANNTVAILAVGGLCRDIASRYGVDFRRSASLLDTFSCIVQSLLPYGAQILIASGLAGIAAVRIIPVLYYSFALFVAAIVSIFWVRTLRVATVS